MNRRSPGFTLVEVLVSVSIILILAGLIFAGSQRWIEQSRAAACTGNLRSLGICLQSYLTDHNQQMPAIAAGRASRNEEIATIDTVLADYAGNPKTFACPSDRKLAEESGTSYYWNSAMSSQNLLTLNFLAFVQDASRIPLLCDKEGWHVHSEHKVNFLYADGRVARELNLFTAP